MFAVTVQCNRIECEFWLSNNCSYGGEAISIDQDGFCDTYEPRSLGENNEEENEE